MEFVVSVDKSDESTAAVHEAAQLAETVGASLTLVHTVQQNVIPSGSDGPIYEGLSKAEQRAEELLRGMESRLSEYDVSVSRELLYGGPVEAVVGYLEENQPEAVYIGHRDIPSKQHELGGSFAKKLIGESPVPVTVVRQASL